MTIETSPERDAFDDELAALFRAAEPAGPDLAFNEKLERRLAARARARLVSLSAAAGAGALVCVATLAGFSGGTLNFGGVLSLDLGPVVLGLLGAAVLASAHPLSRVL